MDDWLNNFHRSQKEFTTDQKLIQSTSINFLYL